MIYNIEIKKNKDKYQIWVNGGLSSSFDVDIFERQQIFNLAKKMFEPTTLNGDIVNIEDKTGENIFVCSKCGGEDVERKMWFNLKKGNLDIISDDEEDCWCNNCNEHVELKEIEREKNVKTKSED